MTNGTKSGPRTYNKQSSENYRNNHFWKKPNRYQRVLKKMIENEENNLINVCARVLGNDKEG